MFTGIVQGMAEIVMIEDKVGLRTHTISLPNEYAHNIRLGASIAQNGCCLTVTKIEGNDVTFDMMQETLSLTNLGEYKVGDKVNFERSAKVGDEIGGHNMSGHIMTTAQLIKIDISENNCTQWFKLDAKYMPYVMPKGFIGLDGCSLTIGDVVKDTFNVHLIPETLHTTLFGTRKVGDRINVEIDSQTQTIVDTVERVLATRVADSLQ